MTAAPQDPPQRFQIGSLRCSVASDPCHYAELLIELYRATLEPADGQPEPVDIVFDFIEAPASKREAVNQLSVERIPHGHRFVTDPVTVELTRRHGETRILVAVTAREFDDAELSFHFWIILNRALLKLDRLLLHAAGIIVDGRVIVVCGDNGAGKSTLSVAMGLRGATLLSEDSLLVTRTSAALMVSGLTRQMRIPRQTEDRLLPGRLLDQRITEDGRNKRMVDADQIFATRWGHDLVPERIFFLRRGEQAEVRPLSARDALARLIDNTRHSYRFAGAEDINDHLDLVADLAMNVPAFDATRTESLDDLDDLVEMLSAR